MKKILFLTSLLTFLFFTALKPSSAYALEPGDVITDNPGALGSVVIVTGIDPTTGAAYVAPYEPPDPSNPCAIAGTCYAGTPTSSYIPPGPSCPSGTAFMTDPTNITYTTTASCGFNGGPWLTGETGTCPDGTSVSASRACYDNTDLTAALGSACFNNHYICKQLTCPAGTTQTVGLAHQTYSAWTSGYGQGGTLCPGGQYGSGTGTCIDGAPAAYAAPVGTCVSSPSIDTGLANSCAAGGHFVCLAPVIPAATPTPTATPTPIPPASCTSLTANPSSIAAGGGSVALSLNNCTPLIPPPTFTWPQPTVIPVPGSGPGGTGPCATSSCTYTPPPTACVPATVTQNATISNSVGGHTYSTAITVIPNNTVTGTVLVDSSSDNCNTPHVLSGVTVSLVDGSSGSPGGPFTNTTTDSFGKYTLVNSKACLQQYIVVSGQTVKLARSTTDPTYPSFISTSLSAGTTYGPFTIVPPATKTVDFCVGAVSPWFQTTTGDVRFPGFSDPIPGTAIPPVVATDLNYPGIPISSLTSLASPALGLGTASTASKNWQVGQEYNYANTSSTLLGGMSYSFYKSQAKKRNITVNTNNNQNVDIGVAPFTTSGVYDLTWGNALAGTGPTITSSTTITGKHLVILVDNPATIASSINLGAPGTNSLLVLAAKSDLHIGSGVGGAASNDTTTQLDGYYTSESSIVLDSIQNCPTTPDKRLNVGGALIANSLHPFATGDRGIIQKTRSLCTNDPNYPFLKVYQRPDFITQMNDFYKLSTKTFQEVAP